MELRARMPEQAGQPVQTPTAFEARNLALILDRPVIALSYKYRLLARPEGRSIHQRLAYDFERSHRRLLRVGPAAVDVSRKLRDFPDCLANALESLVVFPPP